MRYIATILTLFSFIEGISQSFPYTFQTWDAKNGLSSNYCNTVVKDANGYLYVGTNNGLYTFNGSNFKKIQYNQENKIINEGNVEDIIIDKYNRIWFASIEAGVGLINTKDQNNHVQYFTPPNTDSFPTLQILNNTKVSRLCFDTKGYLWVGTRGNGLYKFDTATKKFSYIKIENKASYYNKFIRSLYLYKPDTLFVGLVNGLSIINPLTNEITNLKMSIHETGKIFRPTVRKVLPWSADSFMLATDRGTFWLKLNSQTLHNINNEPIKKIDFSKINSTDIFRFSTEEVWIATEDEGVLFYNINTHKFNYSFKKNESSYSIPKGFINKFYKDQNGNMWISHQNGLSLFQIQNTWFNNATGSDSRLLTGTLIADKHRLLCFKSNAITIINTESGEIELKKINVPVKDRVAHCHVNDYSPDDYILFVNHSFFLLNKNTLRVKQLPLDKEKFERFGFQHFRVEKSISDTINNKRQFLLMVKTPQGRVLLNYFPESGDITYYSPPGFKHTDFKNGVTSILKTETGKYWISTMYNGMIYVDGTGSSIQYAHDQTNVSRKIPEGEIKDFTVTTAHDIWLLNEKKGLIHISTNNKNMQCYEVFSEQDGLTDNSLYNIVHDSQKNLWITSNAGLYCFLTQQKDFLKYTATNGFGNMQFHIYDAEMVSLKNGYIGIFEEIGNTTWFKPQSSAREKNIKILLPSLQVNEQLINLNAITAPLSFSPNQNNISFTYDIVDFDKTTFYEVIYKLDDFDNLWHNALQGNEPKYIQLPPGKYIFRIKLRYANNQFSPEKIVQFTIATLWYKTWWFKTIAIILFLLSIYLIIRSYINLRLYEQKKELELQKAVSIERARISTELHDDLGSGLSTIRILSQSIREENNATGNPRLEKISNHSQELMQKMREIVWALNNENDTLDQLISYIRLQSSTLLDNAGISYQYDVPEIIPEIKITGGNRRHIQLMIKETIHNIVKHSHATEVCFTILITDNLTIGIHDNGIGIPGHCVQTSSGNGIKNIKKHTYAVQGVLNIKNQVGTTIQLTVPLQKLSHESVI